MNYHIKELAMNIWLVLPHRTFTFYLYQSCKFIQGQRQIPDFPQYIILLFPLLLVYKATNFINSFKNILSPYLSFALAPICYILKIMQLFIFLHIKHHTNQYNHIENSNSRPHRMSKHKRICSEVS